MTDPAEPDLYAADVRAEVEEWHTSVDDAERAIGIGRRCANRLGKELYDIELVEGPDLKDAYHEMDLIARSLRNLRRIVVARRRMLTPDDRT